MIVQYWYFKFDNLYFKLNINKNVGKLLYMQIKKSWDRIAYSAPRKICFYTHDHTKKFKIKRDRILNWSRKKVKFGDRIEDSVLIIFVKKKK